MLMAMVNAESLLVFWGDGYLRFIKGFAWGWARVGMDLDMVDSFTAKMNIYYV